MTRHLGIGYLTWRIYRANEFVAYDWAPEREHYFTRETHLAVVGIFASLQLLFAFWTFKQQRVLHAMLRRAKQD